jgi:2'-5' RNA ligase
MSMFDALPPGPPVPSLAAHPPGDPAVPHTVFFAVTDAAGAESLHERAGQIDRRLGIGGQLLEAGRLHVSLHAVGAYVGERPDADIARWCRVADAVHSAPFEVVFDQVATFGGGGNPLVLKSSGESDRAGLLALHLALGMMLADAGQQIKPRSFTPHMTLSYRGRRIAETPIEPVRWRPRELVLIDSHVGAHRHDLLGCWPLRG